MRPVTSWRVARKPDAVTSASKIVNSFAEWVSSRHLREQRAGPPRSDRAGRRWAWPAPGHTRADVGRPGRRWLTGTRSASAFPLIALGLTVWVALSRLGRRRGGPGRPARQCGNYQRLRP